MFAAFCSKLMQYIPFRGKKTASDCIVQEEKKTTSNPLDVVIKNEQRKYIKKKRVNIKVRDYSLRDSTRKNKIDYSPTKKNRAELIKKCRNLNSMKSTMTTMVESARPTESTV